VIEFASVLILNCARTRRLADPHDNAPTRLPSSFGRNRAVTRTPRIFFQNPAGPANKQPYAAVIAGTAAAQPPSIAAGSIGSRSRSKQRS